VRTTPTLAYSTPASDGSERIRARLHETFVRLGEQQVQQELLFNPDGPALSVLAASPSAVANHLMAWTPAHPEWDILRVRGTKSSDEACLFDELGAALQFPYYFGENWNALWNCITDLNWLRGLSYLVIFDSAEHLLSESERGFQFLLQVLTDAHERWHQETADFGVRGRRPIAFQSVLACEPEAVDALAQRLKDANATFTRL
jgi:RNAse (barnase) inhibitor barstar